MSSLDLTRDWLQSVTRPYAARDGLIKQVLDILQSRRTLSVKTDAFTFDTGHTALLLLLHGTLPISFRDATYHIPIHIWIPHEYPRAPPLAFVVPTKDMGVRKGKEVEPSGRVKEEVVDQWWSSWHDKSIEGLLAQLINVFSAVPPVYARPPDHAAAVVNGGHSRTASGSSQAVIGNNPPPPPSRPLGPPGIQTESLPQYRSAPTPPPNHPHPQFAHARQASGSYPQSPASPIHPGTSQSPPIPNRPPQIPLRQSSQPPGSPTGPMLPQRPYIPQPNVSGFGQAPILAQHSGPRYAYDPNQPQQAMTPPRPAPPPQQPGYGSPQPGYGTPQPGYGVDPRISQPPYPPNGYQSPPPPPQAPTTVPPQPAARPQQRAFQDLLSSPEQASSSLPDMTNPGAPPPIPPSKPPPPSMLHLHSILLPHLNASLPPLLHSLQANRQHLLERQEDLQSGEPAIKDEMARLEAVKKVCDSVGRKLDEVVAKGDERVVDLEQKEEISVDEVVCGISIVHNQLIDLVAEDNAIEDTIYHITRALDSERIDLDRFLKSIRSLAREQYLKRALIERILQGMGQTW